MIITKTINTDLLIREKMQEIHAVQGDTGTRKVAVNLFANREPWVPDDGVSVVIRYHKPDGTGGTYDTLPNGEKAWESTGNTVVFALAPQMLTVPGRVEVQVEIQSGEKILASFPLCVLVEKNVAAGAIKSHHYFNWAQRLEDRLREKLKEAKESGAFDGPVGVTPDLQIGLVTTLEAGSAASATIQGTAEKPVLNLALPRGADAVVDATLSVANQAADAAAVGVALAGKAPDGYGLGSDGLIYSNQISSITQLDAANRTGWYGVQLFDTGSFVINGYEFSSATLYVESYIDSRVVQRLIPARTHYVLWRHSSDGVFSEWEWENPPMQEGIEYRTTERWNGHPVYKQAIEFAMPNTSFVRISPPTGILFSEATVIGFSGVFVSESNMYPFPAVDLSSGANPMTSIFAYNNSGNYTFKCEASGDMSAYTAKIMVSYVKDK